MKRKLLSIVLALCLTLTLLPAMSVAAGSYADTNGHWAESSIERWSAYGIIQGSNGQFDPNGQLTCAQLATILAKLLKLPAAKDAGFSDNKADAWYYDAINRCAAAGILNGNGDGTVTPEAPITRERAMVMLARALGIEPLRSPDLTRYTDAAQVSAYAQGYVAALVRTDIVKGDVNGKLNPAGLITRAEIVTIVDRMVTIYVNADGAAVSAANGGTVLVVAKNVKVENAPEGTKIIAGKDASGLSVNGKAVSAGQTYIVPKAKPSTSGNVIEVPPHAHVYTYVDNGNGTHTATCYAGDMTFTEQHHLVDGQCTLCGAAQTDNSVASVKKSDGTHTYYLTLAEAINAADAGDTVTLVEGSSENFVVPSGKDITLDLNGYEITTSKQPKIEEGGSLTIRGEGGSIILEEAGIYLEGSLTLESGKIESKKPSDVIFIMGNGNFTMTGGMLLADAGACIDASYLTNGVSRLNITGGVVETKDPAVNAIYINNRWGSGKIELTISGGTIKAAKQAAIALDASDSVSTISLTGGTYSSDPSAYVAEGYVAMKNDNGTWTVIAPTAIENGVTIKGIAGYERYAFSTISEAYDEISPKVAALGGLGQETCSKEEFAALYTDDAKITWTIYGKQALVAGSEGKDAHTFTFGRAASYYRNDCNIAAIIVKGGNDSAALDLSATGGTFALPYNWWGEDIKNCEVSFTGITFDGVKSIPSTWASQAQSTPYTFDHCTFNGNIYGYHDYNINLTIQNSTFNAPENTDYAVTLQSTTGINGTVTLDHNTFNGYTRGVNLQRPGTDFIFTNNTITSTVSKPDRAAIQLTDGKSFTVTGNTVRVNAGNAFWFHNAATNSNVTYTISNNNIQAPYLGYYATTFDVNPKITSSGNNFNNTDTTKCMKKNATVAEATNLTAIH